MYELIISVYPELADFDLFDRHIRLQNDSDGEGDYIAVWDYEKPIPDGLKVGK